MRPSTQDNWNENFFRQNSEESRDTNTAAGSSTEEIFLAANKHLGQALCRYGIRKLPLNFAAALPSRVRHAALEFSGRDIAVNSSELTGITFNAAVGILGHEYGHLTGC